MYGGPPYGKSLEAWQKYSISFNLDKVHTPLLMEQMGYGLSNDSLGVEPGTLAYRYEIKMASPGSVNQWKCTTILTTYIRQITQRHGLQRYSEMSTGIDFGCKDMSVRIPKTPISTNVGSICANCAMPTKKLPD